MAKAKKAKRNDDGQIVLPPLMVAPIFETLVGMFDCNVIPDWDQYNSELIEASLKARIDNPEGVYRSNSAGVWHSNDQQFKKPEFRRLMELESHLLSKYIQAAYQGDANNTYKMKFAAWIMMYSRGGYATLHTHPNCHMACVYYCHDSPEEELTMATGVKVRSGDIEFVDTRSNETMMVSGLNQFPRFKQTPKAGHILMFPAWLPHFVHPVSGEKDRISIAANMTILETIPKE